MNPPSKSIPFKFRRVQLKGIFLVEVAGIWLRSIQHDPFWMGKSKFPTETIVYQEIYPSLEWIAHSGTSGYTPFFRLWSKWRLFVSPLQWAARTPIVCCVISVAFPANGKERALQNKNRQWKGASDAFPWKSIVDWTIGSGCMAVDPWKIAQEGSSVFKTKEHYGPGKTMAPTHSASLWPQ